MKNLAIAKGEAISKKNHMAQIVRFHEIGGADVLKIEELPLTEPIEGEVRLKVEAFSLNRGEVMFREGKYLYAPELPSRLGYEASGMVDAVGPGVTDIKIGDRVSTIPAFSMGKYGVYGESAGKCCSPISPESFSNRGLRNMDAIYNCFRCTFGIW